MNATNMRKTPFILILFSLLFAGCKKFAEEPEKKCFIPYVDFVAQHVNTSTLEVTFTAVTSYNGTISSHKWDFGDGTGFNGETPPAHQYRAPGTYKIKYTVANECGEAFWTNDIVISNCLPDTKFSTTYVNDSTVQFTNQTQSSSATNYTWNFGDGTTSTSSAGTVTHVYREDKSFTVSLKAKNSCGENNFTGTVSVCRRPVPSQTVTVSGCGTVSINASASKNAAKFQWNFGNGTILPATPSASPTISYTYPNSGNYTIKLTVFNSSGCDSASVSKEVTLSTATLGTNSNWSYTSDDLKFNFSRETIANASSYKWNFGDGTTSALQNPAKEYADPGKYTITLTASNGCGSSYEFSVPINVPYYKPLNNTPNADFVQVLAVSPAEIYFLGKNAKLYRTDTAGNWSQPVNLPHDLKFDDNTRLFKDLNNDVWIYGKGEIAKLSGTSWTSYFSSTRFSDKTVINSMAVDKWGNLWTIGDGKLRKGNDDISSSSFSSLAYDPNAQRLWITSSNSNSLYFINGNSTHVNSVSVPGMIGGGDEIKVSPDGEVYFTTGSGIIRTDNAGNVIGNYGFFNTGGLIFGRPSTFDFDSKGNLWVLYSKHLYKLPVNDSGNTKKYSFNADLDDLASISVLRVTETDSDILLAKTSGNVAIKIR
jgi:PKD repeat protein